MNRFMIFAIVIGGLATVSAQSVVVRGGAGDTATGAFAFDTNSVQSLVWKLSDDENWSSAKSTLIEKASGDDQIEVVYYLEKFKTMRAKDEQFVTRVDSVISALAESGLHPLTSESVATEAKAISSKLSKMAKAEIKDEITNEVLMSLVRARKQVDRAQTMIETGEVPAPSGMSAGGGVIRRRGGAGRN